MGESSKKEDKEERRFSQEQREGSGKLEGRSEKVEKGNKADRKFSEEQYQMLLRCSDAKDMTERNEWRRQNTSCTGGIGGRFCNCINKKGREFC